MSVKERILTIRLIEKAAKQPMFAASLGIEVVQEISSEEEDPP